MTDELKEQIILQIIKDYKNRCEWTDDYVKEKYSIAIKYMNDNFDRFLKFNNDGAIQSKSQGERSVTYKTDINNFIRTDYILKSLLGLPFIRCH